MNGLSLMKSLGINTEFKLSVSNSGEEITTIIEGNRMIVDAGLMSLVDAVAKQNEISLTDKLEQMMHMAKLKDTLDSESAESDDEDEPEGCDGDCENCTRHDEMPPALKGLFDTLFGMDDEEDED